MPIFDFQCQGCGKLFDLMITNSEKSKVKCPECSSADIKQMLSSFNTGRAAKTIPDACSTCCAHGGGGCNFDH